MSRVARFTTVLPLLLLALFGAPFSLCTAQSAAPPQAKEIKASEPASETANPEGYKLIRDDYTLDTQDGKRIGHTHVRIYSRDTREGKVYLTRYWSESTSLREGDVTSTVSNSQVIEDEKGRVISFRNIDMEPGSRVVIEGQVVGDKIRVRNNKMSRVYNYTPGMIGPRAYDELQRTRKYKEGDTFRVISFEPTSPDLPDIIEHKVIGKVQKVIAPMPPLPLPVSTPAADAPGQISGSPDKPAETKDAPAEASKDKETKPAEEKKRGGEASAPVSATPSPQIQPVIQGKEETVWKVEEKHSLIPRSKIATWISLKGDLLMSDADMPSLGFFQSVVCTREDTLKPFIPSSMQSDMDIIVSPGLPNYKALTTAKYEVTAPGGTADGASMVLEGPEQHVISRSQGSVEVEVRRLTFASASVNWKLPFVPSKSTSEELRACLAEAPYIELTPAIKQLSAKALNGETNPVKAARAIERYVRSYISNKNYNVGFATADETLRSKAGDCTEHAVLCAALARAAGLPARVVVGLGYLPRDYSDKDTKDGKPKYTGTFGFHMWAEAYVGNPGETSAGADWQPMDAALDGFDVGHIAILRTSLSDSQSMVDLTNAVTQFMGKLSIRVLETK